MGLSLAGLALCFVLSGCGKKPGHVDPPVGVKDDAFPLVYPDADADPAPDVEPDPSIPVRTPPRLKKSEEK